MQNKEGIEQPCDGRMIIGYGPAKHNIKQSWHIMNKDFRAIYRSIGFREIVCVKPDRRSDS
ncbi:hypothetical protein [uncultured Maribacter sp.]|uniref:hypothetical protein n=1 Tax=uncultured Maribacter sp. TaxID=431308 RepID=UPI0030EC4867